jgi:hypothetical protein
MESARSTEGFSRRIAIADANNIVAVLDLNQVNSEYQVFAEDYLVKFQVALEDLKVTVGLSSLLPAPYPDVNALMSDAQQQAEIAKIRTEGQKISLGLYTAKGNGPWQYESEVVLMNQGGSETHVPILVPFLSSNETLLVGGDFKLGVKVEPKWNQPLKANDYLVVRGTYRQIVSFTSKKKDDIDELKARIESLELALHGRLTNLPANSLLGRGSTIGVAEIIPQSTFAKPADIDTAIFNLIGGAPAALNTLDELAQALADDQNFATSIINALATKVSLSGNEIIAGNKSFSGITTVSNIKFPSSPVASADPNTIDDYNEGTWTPVLAYTSPGTSSITFSRNTGRFQKIGNRVTITFDIRLATFSKGSASGFLVVTGLPYPTRPGSGYDNNYGFLVVANTPFSGIPFLDTGNGLSGGATRIYVFKCVTNSVNTPLDDPIAGALYWGQIQYESS